MSITNSARVELVKHGLTLPHHNTTQSKSQTPIFWRDYLIKKFSHKTFNTIEFHEFFLKLENTLKTSVVNLAILDCFGQQSENHFFKWTDCNPSYFSDHTCCSKKSSWKSWTFDGSHSKTNMKVDWGFVVFSHTWRQKNRGWPSVILNWFSKKLVKSQLESH